MLPKRYSFIVADRSSGVMHRFTLAVRPTLALFAAILGLPIGWTVQSGWSTATQIEQLQLRSARRARGRRVRRPRGAVVPFKRRRRQWSPRRRRFAPRRS